MKAAGSAEQLLLMYQEKPQLEVLHQELLGGEETELRAGRYGKIQPFPHCFSSNL